MSKEKSAGMRAGRSQARWDDLEAFGIIATGIVAGKTLPQIADDPLSGIGGRRMLYFRLGRLEQDLGRRLVDRRPWGREARLTSAGDEVAGFVTDLLAVRRRLHDAGAQPAVPVLRIVTHATLVSTLLPQVLKDQGSRPPSRFNLELVLVRSYPEALAAVADGRADVGLYLTFPDLDRTSLPRNVRRERLGETEVVVLCHPRHRFASRAPRAPYKSPLRLSTGRAGRLRRDDLVDETVIVRGHIDEHILPPGGPSGRRIIVPHTLDKLAYVRLGLGVTLFPRLIFAILGAPSDLRALPFRPPLTLVLALLQPRKRLRPLGEAAAFVENLRLACARLARRG